MSNLLFYVLGQDGMPACPTHGIRLVTDFFTSEAGEQFERGKCPLCKRTYTFVIEETKNA